MLGTRAQETSFFEVSERRLSFLTTRGLPVGSLSRAVRQVLIRTTGWISRLLGLIAPMRNS